MVVQCISEDHPNQSSTEGLYGPPQALPVRFHPSIQLDHGQQGLYGPPADQGSSDSGAVWATEVRATLTIHQIDWCYRNGLARGRVVWTTTKGTSQVARPGAVWATESSNEADAVKSRDLGLYGPPSQATRHESVWKWMQVKVVMMVNDRH